MVLEAGETGWTVFGEEFATNPRDAVPTEFFRFIGFWHSCQGEFGLSHLPDPGGMSGQAAWTIDAFGICSGAEAEARKEEKGRPT